MRKIFGTECWVRLAWCTLWFGAAGVTYADDHAGFGDNLPALMAPDVTDSLLLDGARRADRMLVVGEFGHVIFSDDEGATWKQASTPTRSALTGVTFADNDTAFAVGHDAVILRSQDRGQNWERKHFDPDLQTPLLDVWFADAQRGFAVGAYGLFLETADGGETWNRRPFNSQPLPAPPAADGESVDAASTEEEADEFDDDWVDPEFGEDYHLNHITAAADGTLYIAAEAGHYYRSDDGGAVWFRLAPPYSGSLFGTLPLGGDALLVFGMRGNLFHSPDKGVSYTPIATGVESLLTAATRDSSGRISLVGLAGTVLQSDDGGQRFELHRQSDRNGNMMVLASGEQGLVLIGESGLARLTDAQIRSGGTP